MIGVTLFRRCYECENGKTMCLSTLLGTSRMSPTTHSPARPDVCAQTWPAPLTPRYVREIGPTFS
nr:hypothetical protein GCM10017745_47530 [Saccharothrix mutabilis subsp. capreolus]